MKPMHFVVLAILAVVSTVAAITSYAANNTWNQGRATGARMFPSLVADAGKVAAIEVRQGDKVVTVEKKDGAWRLKERGGYPVVIEKVRGLMVSLAEADLVEAKTRVAERYSLIEVEDPASKDAKSRGVRLLDDKGGIVAETVVGKKKGDAFGYGKVGTYVRKSAEAQTWLANTGIDAPVDIKDWIKTDVFQADSSKVNRVTLEVAGEQPLKIERNADKKIAIVGTIPPGQKLKDEGAAEGIARAAAFIDMDDVRKLAASPTGKDVSTIKVEVEGGLTVALRLRKEGDSQWLSVTAAGEGDAKKTADEITARTAGWEYKLSASKTSALLKRRADLYEKAADPKG